MFADLALLKAHIRADDFTADDALLASYMKTGEQIILKWVNRSEEELLEMGGGEIPAPLQTALFLLCGHWYANPEAGAAADIKGIAFGVKSLVYPYVKLSRQ